MSNKKLKSNSFERSRARAFYIVMIPFTFFVLLTKGYPVIWGILMSFTNFDGLNMDRTKFVGLYNYIRVFQDPEVMPAIWNVIKITLIQVPLAMIASVGLSLLLAKDRKGVGLFRVLIYLPSVLPTVASAIVWQQIYTRDGLFDNITKALGLGRQPWLSHKYLQFSLIVMMLWTCGSSILVKIAAIKAIPNDLYEAAKIEGANSWQTTIKITLPMMSNMLYMSLTTAIIGMLQLMGQVVMLVGLGNNVGLTTVPPRTGYTYMIHMYQQIFVKNRFGYGLALVWVYFIFIMTITVILEKTKKYWVYTEVDDYEETKKRGKKR